MQSNEEREWAERLKREVAGFEQVKASTGGDSVARGIIDELDDLRRKLESLAIGFVTPSITLCFVAELHGMAERAGELAGGIAEIVKGNASSVERLTFDPFAFPEEADRH